MKKIIYIGLVSTMSLMFNGCGSAPKRIDPKGDETLTTTDGVNVKDWHIAADKAIKSLLSSGVLNRNDGRKNIVMVSLVKNETTQHINTDILTNKIRRAILQSGLAMTTTAISANGMEDKATKQVRDLSKDKMFDQKTVQKNGTVIAPDMSLAGKIIQQQTTQGRDKESYFFFHITLTDLKTGLAVWEDNVEVVKQETKPLLGW
ncbi:penicillin-binding protein activator LpoB [Lentisphaerota bacterium WC36G]|nr:penicillin-binding protein activator LpoB [Lentisphaerae bacterium WC36]